MTREVAVPDLSPDRRAWDLPQGPVQLWIAVPSDTGRLMGAAPIDRQMEPGWRDGRLTIGFKPVPVPITARGRTTGRGYIVAVSRQQWRPLAWIDLGEPRLFRPGDMLTVFDGALAMDFTGGPNDPWMT